jgi:D-aspartate ligase
MNNEVLVIGGNHQNPLGLIEALGQKGLSPYVIINDNCKSSFVLKSKFIKKGWICPTDAEVLDCIIKNFKDTKLKTVAFACSDNIACLLNENYNKLHDILYLPTINEQGHLTQWMDKEKMIKVAKSLGMNVPSTWLVVNKLIPDDIEYPCVTKSLSSVKKGKSEFALCNSREELLEFIDNHVHSHTIQVQKYIDMEFEFQYLGCSLNRGEEIIIPGHTHIEETNKFNNITFLKYKEGRVIEDPTTLLKTEEFIRESGYSGLFSVEFMHDKVGRDYFLEMNFRNDGNGIVATAAGTNLPYIWYLYCTGDDYKMEIASSYVKETYCAPEDSYFISMLQGEISYKTWLKNMKKVTCYITYFKNDRGPFWALMWLQKKAIISSLVLFVMRKIHINK